MQSYTSVSDTSDTIRDILCKFVTVMMALDSPTVSVLLSTLISSLWLFLRENYRDAQISQRSYLHPASESLPHRSWSAHP